MRVLFFAFILSITGCQAIVYGTADDLQNLAVGMAKPEVLKVMGAPIEVAVDAEKRQEVLTFKRMAGVVSWAPHAYDVVLVDGKVAKYGRR